MFANECTKKLSLVLYISSSKLGVGVIKRLADEESFKQLSIWRTFFDLILLKNMFNRNKHVLIIKW